jgi:hypothetical protein
LRWGFKLVAYVALLRGAAARFSTSIGIKEMNEVVVISNNFTNNFAGLVTSGVEPEVEGGPPVGLP